jgi:hypothetical protein
MRIPKVSASKSLATRSLALAVLATAPLGVALAQSRPALVEASIPFAGRGGIRDWSADRDRGLWVQAASRQWYYARFMGTCNGLSFATAIGFDMRFQDSFDRWSSIVVPGYGRCPVQSFTTSDGPPRRRKKASAESPPAAG